MLSAVCVLTLLGCGDEPGGASPGAAASKPHTPKVTRALLDESLRLGRAFLLANQLDSGVHRYGFDLTTGKGLDEDMAARRAAALWVLAIIHRESPTPETHAAVLRGIDYWLDHSNLDTRGRRFVDYPHEIAEMTNTQALVCLSITDALPTFDDELRERYGVPLRELIDGLLAMRMPNGQFFGTYAPNDGAGLGPPTAYADGEALLAIVRYAQLTGDERVRAICVESAEAMRKAHMADDVLNAGPTDGVATSYYQWGTMAYFDMYDAGWPEAQRFGQLAVDMTRWMIRAVGWTEDAVVAPQPHTNSGWVLEGVIYAREAARRLGQDDVVAQFDRVIDSELYRITAWQVGVSIASDYVRSLTPADDRAVGGVLMSPNSPVLRLDYSMHQFHAVQLARRFIYTE